MFLLLQGLAAPLLLFVAAGVKALPFNQDGSDSFFFESTDFGQLTTDPGSPIGNGLTDPFFGSSVALAPPDENSNFLAQIFEQPIDFESSPTLNFPPLDENSNFLAQTFEQPIDFGPSSTLNFPPPLDENSNLLALGQNFQEPIVPEPFVFPDNGNPFSTVPDFGFGSLLAAAMSCPSGGSLFCCPDRADENCIPSKSSSCFKILHDRFCSKWSFDF